MLNKIIVNKFTKIKVLPLNPDEPIKVLNSFCNVIIIICHKYEKRVGINQKERGRIVKLIRELNQFNE